jgi:hypothetical protein
MVKWSVFTKIIGLYSFVVLGRDLVVGITTRYCLEGLGIESGWGAMFYANLQAGPLAHTASRRTTTGSLSRGTAAGAWR